MRHALRQDKKVLLFLAKKINDNNLLILRVCMNRIRDETFNFLGV